MVNLRKENAGWRRIWAGPVGLRVQRTVKPQRDKEVRQLMVANDKEIQVIFPDKNVLMEPNRLVAESLEKQGSGKSRVVLTRVVPANRACTGKDNKPNWFCQ